MELGTDIVESMILTALKERSDIGKDEIRASVELIASAVGVSDRARQEELCRRLEAKLAIRLELGHVICEPYTPWLESRKAEISPFYWNRYLGLLEGKGYSPGVITRLDQITDRILGLLENPERQGSWSRRGLVVGHVQSGKTANYIGLINKAADAGYRLIILIAGTLNNLRKQTQIRVDEGFVGKDSSLILRTTATREDRLVGVGHRDQQRFPIVFTSTKGDFSVRTAQALGLSINAVSEPIILVIKKNLKTLSNLAEWLQRHNTRGGNGLIEDVPLLLIDDEADYASINTNDGGDPTKINEKIRALLQLFTKRCYLGYTATPFANVFINPETDHAMLGEDLFPRDFIISLEAPSNYVGPDQLFGDPRALAAVLPVGDYESTLPLKHKISTEIGALPQSLKNAVEAFVLARAARLCRKQENVHNSMLVNVSRFTRIQQQVRDLIHQYLSSLAHAIRFNYKLSWQEASRSPEMATLHETWSKEYGDTEVAWQDVVARLNDAIAPIVVVEVNSGRSAAQLDYEAHAKAGLNVIAVGGLSLSRGLTLEGLTISYVLRNSQMYDTLLQMGRWFGYRDGYADLTRIYLPSEAIGWYAHITEATSELRREFERMEKLTMTPKDFGLKVRADPETLLITARNKMREAKEMVWSVDLAGKLVETAKIVDGQNHIADNRQALIDLVAQLDIEVAPKQDTVRGNVVWRCVRPDAVLKFLSQFRSHPSHLPSQREAILAYCSDPESPKMDQWDVVLASNSQIGELFDVRGHEIGLQERGTTREDITPPVLRVSGSSARVASRGLEKIGIDEQIVEDAERKFLAEHPDKKNVPDYVYREVRARPLLMLHVFVLKVAPQGDTPGSTIKHVPAWGISFPGVKGAGTRKLVNYKVNLVWWKEQHGDLLSEEEIEEEETDE